MAIAIEKTENSHDWDKDLESFGGSIFMSRIWISVVSNNERLPVYLRFIEDDVLVGMLGGIELPIKKGTDRQLFFYSGIASDGKNAALIARCKTALYEYAQESGYQRVSMRSYDYHSYLDARVGQFKARERTEYVFYLEKEGEQFVNCFDRDLRRRVRKAKKEGAVLKTSFSPELIEILFSLINETYNLRQSKGYGKYNYLFLPFFSRTEIEDLVKKGNAAFYYVEKDNEILSIQIVVFVRKKAYSILMGTSIKGYREGAPSFLFYELATTLRDQGFEYLNIGGVSQGARQAGLKKFKDSLGAEIIKSAEEVTNFISPPLSFLNPFLELKWFLKSLKFMPGRVKLPFLYFIDLIVQKRDRY
jgi:hypothetical protein